MSQKRREEKRKERESENSYDRRTFLLKAGLAVASLGILGYTGYSLLPEKEPTFEEAKRDPTKRAGYVRSVVKDLD